MSSLTPPTQSQKTITAFAVIIIVGILVAAATGLRGDTERTTTSTTSHTTTPTTPSAGNDTTTYNDGTYSAQSEYSVPRSFESISVNVTIRSGVVTDSSVTHSKSDRQSAQYQDEFSSIYKRDVIGKKLSDIHLTYVAGASDTAEGFNEALDQIKHQARS